MEKNKEVVLIGVLKDKRDMDLLLKKKQYRIPALRMPRRKAGYVAFYQPSVFGRTGRRINYYAKIRGCNIVKRKWILPGEPDHPRAEDEYCVLSFDRIIKLRKAIKNRNRTRISFGFTTLKKLLSAGTVFGLFDVPPIEEILAKVLSTAKIRASREHIFHLQDGKQYRLDFAVFCRKGPLNIECDGEKWHSRSSQRKKDALRDAGLEKEGWSIIRFGENEIVGDTEGCVAGISRRIKALGGTLRKSGRPKKQAIPEF